jgi:signal transduction histidine kinase
VKRHSIKTRLIVTVVLSQALLVAGLLSAGLFYAHRRLLATLDEGMQGRAMSLAALVRYTEDANQRLYFDQALVPPPLDRAHPDLFAVWTEKSGFLAHSANWPAGLEIPPDGPNHWNLAQAQVPYRGLRLFKVPVLDREADVTSPPETLTIVYAAPMIRLQKQVWDAGVFIVLTGLLLLGATVLLTLWGIGRELLPLQQLAAQAALISSRNWELHPPEKAEQIAELRPLTESMTTMLARLERSFVQQRQFIGNAAHELKTPVAVLKSTLQSLLQRPRDSDEYRAGLEHALEDLERLEQLLQWMLRLARAEQWAHGALRRDLPVVDITATCEEAVERIRHLGETRNTTICLSKDGAIPFRADPEDLQLVWANLLENAVRYSPPGGSVEFTVARGDGGSAQITVEDHGPGIPPEDLPRIFERFYRGDPSRTRATGGFGLGLAIAKALVEAYGGTITAESAPAKGTRMTVGLPVDPAART